MKRAFENVKIELKANTYFDGKVNSRTVYLENGERVTLGFMQAGEYVFGTADKEIMEILGGSMEVLLPNESQWQIFQENDRFEVSANSEFQIKVTDMVDYCCYYV
ncbi:pyrimidine/purine nucleoside phosphorylase [Fusibacter ferrireducens]|uniref:Pyrimidine/purine nucleoside phosphorylase n=1 Tax=Fusibacter ferrireducens TaxID=2785058 RepID=A0ABR9ZYM9_9FIRM|nr:pyrimidine/purine nucleoside phosphorylase [Fusibacter ferrireducens]MBF4695268.1 pyrimidine/purine nucleoside phosphorylase [Fusibacter ferrireducens]